jgi:hypothetical protein
MVRLIAAITGALPSSASRRTTPATPAVSPATASVPPRIFVRVEASSTNCTPTPRIALPTPATAPRPTTKVLEPLAKSSWTTWASRAARWRGDARAGRAGLAGLGVRRPGGLGGGGALVVGRRERAGDRGAHLLGQRLARRDGERQAEDAAGHAQLQLGARAARRQAQGGVGGASAGVGVHGPGWPARCAGRPRGRAWRDPRTPARPRCAR